jgi:hypothetical protein
MAMQARRQFRNGYLATIFVCHFLKGNYAITVHKIIMEYVLKKEITLRQGDDYAGIRALVFVGAGVCWDAATTSVQLIITPHRDTCNSTLAQSLTIVGAYIVPSATAAGVCTFELTAAQTNTLMKGVRVYGYEVKGSLAGGRVTLADGLVTVI